MGNLFVLFLSVLFLLFGSIRTESRVEGALLFDKERGGAMEGQGQGSNSFGFGSSASLASRELQNYERDQEQPLLSRYHTFEYPSNQQEAIYFRPTFTKRHDKGILLDVGDFVMNGSPNSGLGVMRGETGSKSFLVKSPSSALRVGGMMRNSG